MNDMTKQLNDILAELKKPFAPEDIEWRVQKRSKDKQRGLALAYVTARAAQERLDSLITKGLIISWNANYKSVDMGTTPQYRNGAEVQIPIKGFLCTIALTISDTLTIARSDGANCTDFEPFKGGVSGAFKRAASAWGIGRYLYNLDTPWVPIDQYGNIVRKPNLPVWALPEGYVSKNTTQDELVSVADDMATVDDTPFTPEDDRPANNNRLVIPVGKYKGKDVSEITDKGWIEWAIANMKRLSPELREALTQRLSVL
jgi:hypothetical protein